MVKNRNSQTRLEESAARRKEAKERKKRSEERRQFKQQAQDFLKRLDSSLGALSDYERAAQLLDNEAPTVAMHLWTDIPGGTFNNCNDDEMDMFCSSSSRRRLMDDFSSSCHNTSANRRDRSASLGNQQDIPPPPANKGRSRSNSVPSEAYAYQKHKKGKGGNQKNTGSDSPKHVLLSNSSSNNNHKIPEEATSASPLLCRSHFFLGKCPHHASSASSSTVNSGGSSRKKTTCRYSHFRAVSAANEPRQYSICQALHKGICAATNANKPGYIDLHHMPPHTQQELQLSDRAAAEALPDNLKETEMDSMEMVYHHTLPMSLWMGTAPSNENDEANTSTISGKVCSQLQDRDLSLANVVYVSLGNALLYDRHRDGWLIPSSNTTTSEDLWVTVLGVKETSLQMRRKESIGSEYSQEEVEDIVMHLPGIALEHILTFLPDSAVAAVSRVCRAWNLEIGQNSPNLWRQLLERRQWPIPAPFINVTVMEGQRQRSISESSGQQQHPAVVPNIHCHNLHQLQTSLYRDAFIKHYTMVRNVRAVKNGLAALLSKKAPPAGVQYEMAFQDFSARESAPFYPNQCVGLQVWSDNRVLAAYAEDCSLRLFETGPSTSTNGDTVVCREAVFQSIDPSRHTKRKKCRLLSMNLDDHYVVSLLQQQTVGEGTLRPLLVVMSRERFLLGDEAATVANNKEYHCIIDVGENVLSFLLENSELLDPHCLQRLLQYFEDGGEIEDVEVKVSRSIGALGGGLFLLEVGIFDILHTSHRFLDRKLVLLSVDSGTIVWVGESLPDTERNATFMAASALDVCISCSPKSPRKDEKEKAQSSCTVTVSSAYSSAILVGSLKLGGLEMKILDTSVYPTEPSSDEEGRIFSSIRVMSVSRNAIICVDTLRREVENVQSRMGATMSFYQTSPQGFERGCTTVALDGDLKCGSIVSLDASHALLLCHQYYYPPSAPVAIVPPRPAANEGAGEFALENEEETIEVVAIVVDIATQREIHRECWFAAQCFRGSWFYELPTVAAGGGSTLAATISTMVCGGMIMTGDSVRAESLADPMNNSNAAVVSPSRTPRKKKKNKNARSSKKDGLVQGKRMYF